MSESTSSQPAWHSTFHIVLPDAQGRQILLLPGDGGWTLPFVHIKGGLWVGDSHKIIAALRERMGFGFPFTVLRYLHFDLNKTERWDRAVLVLEVHVPQTEAPLDGYWVDRSMLANLPLVQPEQRQWLQDFLTPSAQNSQAELRAPWAHPGWFAEAARWMTHTLQGLGRAPTGDVEQFKNLGISSVLRVPTAAGLVYLKATADLPLFISEGTVMAHLARRFPGQIPRPLAINAEENWMLLDDFGSDLRSEKAPEADVAGFLRQFGALQAQSAGMVDELLRAGCRDRRLPVLIRQIDELMAHPLTARHTTPDDLARLRAVAPKLKKHCADLDRYSLPDCLVHGDLHLGNVARNGDSYQIFDWSDSCIAHPFVDMIEPYFFYDDTEVQEQLRDAYLSQWTRWEPMEQLREAWRLAEPLAALHQAVSYLYILLGQEELVHREMAHGLGDFLKLAIKAVKE